MWGRSDRPYLVDPSILGRSIDNARVNPTTGLQYGQEKLPLAAFSPTAAQAAAKAWPYYPGSGVVGSLGRNTFWLQGINNWDFSIIKNVRIHERHMLTCRVEMYNMTNGFSSGSQRSRAWWIPAWWATSYSSRWGASPA
jgi:hypothetical protein